MQDGPAAANEPSAVRVCRAHGCKRRSRGTLLLATLLLATLLLAGCDLFVGWDDMDFQADPNQLRQIQSLDLSAVPASQPAATTQPATPEPAEVQLTLEQCRAAALEGNLELKVVLLEPTRAALQVTEAEARFESLLFGEAALSKIDAATATELVGSQVENRTFAGGVQVPLRTGGLLALTLPVNRTETDNPFATLNPSTTANPFLTLSQPLLRGAGWRTNTHIIRIARLEQQKSEALAKLEVIRVLAAADRVYWRLHAARGERAVRQLDLDLAAAQLARARRRVAAGAVPAVEILRAELGVAERREAVIQAENTVADRQRDLKRILQMPNLPLGSATTIVPVSEPSVVPADPAAESLVTLALAQRMELLELELQMAQNLSAVDFQRNGTLPLVALTYTYGVNGLGEDSGDAFDMLFDKRFEDHRVGLRVEVPLGNQAARSRLRQAMVARAATLAQRDQRAEQIRQEVHMTIDALHASWLRILASRQRVALAERVLAAERRQFDQGLRTSTEVLEAQASLADARSAEIRALTEYQIAQVDVAFATGMLPAAQHVRWEPIVPTGAGPIR